MSSTKNMTMKVEREFTIKRKKHPSAPRYNGRANQELGSALTKLMSLLDPVEVEQLFNRELILDEEGTALEFDAVLTTDVVGIALDFEGEGFVSTMMEVVSNVDDVIIGKDAYTEEEFSFTFEEASVARALGYFEVLYRKDADGKDVPFGVDNDMKVQVMVPDSGDAGAPSVPALGAGPDTEPAVDPNAVVPAGLPANIGDIAAASTDPEVLKALIEAATASGVPVIPPVASEVSETPVKEDKCGNDCSTCTTCAPAPKAKKARKAKAVQAVAPVVAPVPKTAAFSVPGGGPGVPMTLGGPVPASLPTSLPAGVVVIKTDVDVGNVINELQNAGKPKKVAPPRPKHAKKLPVPAVNTGGIPHGVMNGIADLCRDRDEGIADMLAGAMGQGIMPDEFTHGLLLQSVHVAAKQLISDEVELLENPGNTFPDLAKDKAHFVKIYAKAQKALGAKFGSEYATHLKEYNDCARSNLKVSDGTSYCYVLPAFNADGTHAPYGSKDIPWAQYPKTAAALSAGSEVSEVPSVEDKCGGDCSTCTSCSPAKRSKRTKKAKPVDVGAVINELQNAGKPSPKPRKAKKAAGPEIAKILEKLQHQQEMSAGFAPQCDANCSICNPGSALLPAKKAKAAVKPAKMLVYMFTGQGDTYLFGMTKAESNALQDDSWDYFSDCCGTGLYKEYDSIKELNASGIPYTIWSEGPVY